MYDDEIIELQRELMEAQGQDPDRKIKARIAKTQQRREDIKLLSEHTNLCSAKIADTLNLPEWYVKMEKDKIDREERSRRTFLATGELELPDQYVGISILK